MRESRVLTKTAKDSALHAQGAEGSGTVAGKLVLSHACAGAFDRRFVRDDCQIVRLLHQCDLSGRFKHATARSNRRGTDELQLWRSFANAVEEKKANAFFYTHPSRTNPPVAKNLGHTLIRTFVFFPGANVFAHSDQLARPLFFKFWAHPGKLAARWDHERKHALARAPLHAGVIEHAGAWFDIDGVDLVLAHQTPGLLDS